MRPSTMGFEEHYSDDSGVEFAVRYKAKEFSDSGGEGVIEFEHIDVAKFPVEKVDWLIECLKEIRSQSGQALVRGSEE